MCGSRRELHRAHRQQPSPRGRGAAGSTSPRATPGASRGLLGLTPGAAPWGASAAAQALPGTTELSANTAAFPCTLAGGYGAALRLGPGPAPLPSPTGRSSPTEVGSPSARPRGPRERLRARPKLRSRTAGAWTGPASGRRRALRRWRRRWRRRTPTRHLQRPGHRLLRPQLRPAPRRAGRCSAACLRSPTPRATTRCRCRPNRSPRSCSWLATRPPACRRGVDSEWTYAHGHADSPGLRQCLPEPDAAPSPTSTPTKGSSSPKGHARGVGGLHRPVGLDVSDLPLRVERPSSTSDHGVAQRPRRRSLTVLHWSTTSPPRACCSPPSRPCGLRERGPRRWAATVTWIAPIRSYGAYFIGVTSPSSPSHWSWPPGAQLRDRHGAGKPRPGGDYPAPGSCGRRAEQRRRGRRRAGRRRHHLSEEHMLGFSSSASSLTVVVEDSPPTASGSLRAAVGPVRASVLLDSGCPDRRPPPPARPCATARPLRDLRRNHRLSLAGALRGRILPARPRASLLPLARPLQGVCAQRAASALLWKLLLHPGEACDGSGVGGAACTGPDGGCNSATAPNACWPDCVAAHCGDLGGRLGRAAISLLGQAINGTGKAAVPPPARSSASSRPGPAAWRGR